MFFNHILPVEYSTKDFLNKYQNTEPSKIQTFRILDTFVIILDGTSQANRLTIWKPD
jgi:hypothetical protein